LRTARIARLRWRRSCSQANTICRGCSYGSTPRKRGEPAVGVPLPAADYGFRDTSASARESGISRARE
jgi:hypothetical protein